MRASVVVVRGLGRCSLRVLERRLSSCGAQAQLLRGMWDLPGPGIEPVSPALAGGFLTTAPPGKPPFIFIFYFLFLKIFIYFFIIFGCVGSSFLCEAFSSCGKRGPFFITVRRPLTIAASLVAEHRLQTRRLSSCGSRAQLLLGMWDPPRPGFEPVSPALAGRFSTTAPPGKPPFFFNVLNCVVEFEFIMQPFVFYLLPLSSLPFFLSFLPLD